jgi:hypothetical protein
MFLHSTLRTLAQTPPGPHVSLFLPTSPSSDTTQDGALHLKNLLKDAHGQLTANGLSAAEAEKVLAPAEKHVGDRHFWQQQRLGLALFLSPAGLVEVSVDHTLEPVAVAGDLFDVLPLMPGLTSDDTFVAISASQEAISVYRGNATGMESMTIEGMPTSLDDVLTDDDYENPVLASPPARPNTGTHNMSNSQVYGAAPPEWQAMVRRKFAGRIASSLNGSHVSPGSPLILIADNDMAGDLSTAIGADAVVTTHPESLTEPQRHSGAWKAAQPLIDKKRVEALNTLATRLGQGTAVATDPSEVDQASSEGRIELLAIAHSTPDKTVSRALWATVNHGGEVLWAGDVTPPLATGVAALLRY